MINKSYRLMVVSSYSQASWLPTIRLWDYPTMGLYQ